MTDHQRIPRLESTLGSSKGTACNKSFSNTNNNLHKRMKREWIWNKMHIPEEQNGTFPHHVGKITSTIKNPNAKYVLEGEGAGTVFRVDEFTGDVSVSERLDREKKAEYELTALIYNRLTNQQMEDPSKFRIIIHDINDNAPVFVQKVFNGSVVEMSPLGTSVTKVTAVDADDPTLHGHADVFYEVTDGKNYFRIDNSGTIYTAVPDLDREQNASYTVRVKARDGKGLHNEELGTATVIIKLVDINDNFPAFKQKNFTFEVLENVSLTGEVGRLKVEDIDEPQNRDTKYSFRQGNYQDTFKIVPNRYTNEGVIQPTKLLDFEKIPEYRFVVEATDANINYAYSTRKDLENLAKVIIKVIDVDEPPVFTQSSYTFIVQEEGAMKIPIGCISASDPDKLMGVGIQVLVTIFICIFTILALILLLIVWRRRHKKDLSVLKKNVEEIHEQLVAYDEEGGGEMDTTSYDVSVLNSARQRGIVCSRMPLEDAPCKYSREQKIPENGLSGIGEMGIMIEMKKDEADNDGDILPYDTLHIFGYEGAESIAESLSSLGSGSSDLDIDYDFLNDWGPRFKMLAELYGLEPSGDLLY
uniref:Cadherin-5 n=1 Tax=Naja naja TaxID=35670 RepID=A0A8C6XVC5_NAJNA